MAKIAVVGSREGIPDELVWKAVAALPEGTTVISGGARGVDLSAERAANFGGIPMIVFPAKWELYGKSAGFVRNYDIARECDGLIAFWNGKTRGTMDVIQKTRNLGKPVWVYNVAAPDPRV